MKKRIAVFALLLCLCLSGCGQAATERSAAPTPTPKPFVETKESFQAQTDGRTIVGVSYTPVEYSGKLPTVIFCHGYMSSYMAGQSYGKYLAEQGYAVSMFDFCGGGPQSKSDGAFEDMTCETELSDLREIVDYVKSKDCVDADRLYLMGESMGGFVSTLFISEHAEEFAGLILLWPAFSIPGDAADPASSETIQNATDAYYAAAAAYAGRMEEIQHSVNQPVLIFHGTADDVVLVRYSRAAAECFPNAVYHELEGAGHGMLSTEQAVFVKETIKAYLEGHA